MRELRSFWFDHEPQLCYHGYTMEAIQETGQFTQTNIQDPKVKEIVTVHDAATITQGAAADVGKALTQTGLNDTEIAQTVSAGPHTSLNHNPIAINFSLPASDKIKASSHGDYLEKDNLLYQIASLVPGSGLFLQKLYNAPTRNVAMAEQKEQEERMEFKKTHTQTSHAQPISLVENGQTQTIQNTPITIATTKAEPIVEQEPEALIQTEPPAVVEPKDETEQLAEAA